MAYHDRIVSICRNRKGKFNTKCLISLLSGVVGKQEMFADAGQASSFDWLCSGDAVVVDGGAGQ